MAKTTRSSNAAKAQKGKISTKAHVAKAGKSKASVTKGQAVKSATKKAATPRAAAKPAKKAIAKKVVAKPATAKKHAAKPAVRKAAPKPPAKKASPARKPAAKKAAVKKPVVKKAAPKKPATRKVPVGKAVARKTATKPVAKPVTKKLVAPVKQAAKPVGKPAVPSKAAPSKAVPAKPIPAPVVKPLSPAPASNLFKGKVASATAMVTPRAAATAARHASPNTKKNSSSSMNKLATKKLDNGITREDGRYALPSTSIIDLPKGYHPSSKEEYMNPQHLAYFRNKLRDWRDQLVEESRQTMDNLRDEVRDVGDEAERATRETENSLELRTRDRYRKLISKIDKALRRIEEGSYGFCEETDEEIGVERLDARPIATLSLDAQERREHLQKQMGD